MREFGGGSFDNFNLSLLTFSALCGKLLGKLIVYAFYGLQLFSLLSLLDIFRVCIDLFIDLFVLVYLS